MITYLCTKSTGSGWVHVRVTDVDVAVAAKLVGDGGVISMQGIDRTSMCTCQIKL